MPELPEVETTIRKIRPHILDKEIVDFRVSEEGKKLIGKYTQAEFRKLVIAKKFSSISRLGKYLIFQLDDGNKIIGHLRMSGRMTVSQGAPLKHNHNRLQIQFKDGTFFNFLDTRRFATFHFVKETEIYKSLAKLGPDAISDKLTAKIFQERINGRQKSIYATLLDQEIIAGVGNIYANEAMFAAKIHPLSKAGKIKFARLEILLTEVKAVLNKSIHYKGTTLLDKTYHGGDFFKQLLIYGHSGKNCIVCGTVIKRLRVGGRSVFVCEVCQIRD